MNIEDCKHFEEGCIDSLCPLCGDSIWYPDEPICKVRKYANLPYIKKQKKIAKLKLNDCYFFTKRILDSIKHVTKRLKGADPDKTNAEEKWFKQRERTQRKPARITLFV